MLGTKNFMSEKLSQFNKNMRILQVNKFYYARGGADKYFLELSQALTQAGHEVAVFSMEHPKNQATPYAKYFVSRLSFNEGGFKDKLKTPGRVIYSLEAKRKFKKLVIDFKPDIIHIHNIYHQLSPSILDVVKKFNIPVVMHLHDYKLICPNYQLFTNGHVCEACKPDHYCECTKKRCFKNSFSKSALATLEMFIHHRCLKIYAKNIHTLIAPSAFMKQKLVEFNWPENKIKVIVNPFSASLQASEKELNDAKSENYLLFFGRLSKEKGLLTLVEAAAKTQSNLKFAGIGEQQDMLETEAKKHNVKAEFLGFKSGEELKNIILKAKAVIIPSIWYENMPLSLLEALNLGKPVLASRIGGLPEIIQEGQNGYLFNPGDASDLADKINKLNQSDLNKISQFARNSVKDFSPEKNLQQVIAVYQEVLSKNKQ